MSSPLLNRQISDPDLDRVDHALGRPVNPLEGTFRNYYCASEDVARELRGSPWWAECTRSWTCGPMFRVTRAGREALAAHLAKSDTAAGA